MRFSSRSLSAVKDFLPPVLSHKGGQSVQTQGMKKLVEFYQRIPKGPAPQLPKATGWNRYRENYFGKNASYKPIVHAILGIGLLSYAIDYQFHLKDHHGH